MYPNYPPNPNQGQFPGYPPQQGNFPQQPGYPQQPGFPSPYGDQQQQQGAFYPPQPNAFPPQQQQAGYPPQQFGSAYPTYAPQFPHQNQGGFPPQQQMPPQQPMMTQQYSHQMMTSPNVGASASVHHQAARPTIMPIPNFDAANDAGILRKAMKGFGTDEDAIINVLCRRTSAQRMEIAKAFKTAYGKDLIENIKKECSGNFEKLCVGLLKPLPQYYAEALYEAMEGVGTEEDVLIEVMCGLNNREVQAVTNAFHQLYGQSLEQALKSETSNCLKRILVSLSTGNRDESMVTNIESAKNDAQCLKDAGVGRMGTDESEFNRILCLRNHAQIRLVAQEYEKLTGNTLEKDIKREFSGDVETAMVSVLRCALNRPLFFAKRINKAVAGFGTDDSSLIRLIVTRSEIDMMDIKEEYQKKFNEPLKNAIKGDTSGHYKHGLYTLIGENRN